MATSFGANLSPDFTVLGKIGETIKSTGEERQLKETLADLDSSDPASLRTKANQVMKIGSPTALDTAMKLHNLAQQREALTQKGTEADTLRAWLSNPARQGLLSPALAPPVQPQAPAPPDGGGGATFSLPPAGAGGLPQTVPGPFPAPPAATPPAAIPSPVAPPPARPTMAPPPPQLKPGEQFSGMEGGEVVGGGADVLVPQAPDIARMLQAPPQGVSGSPLPPTGATGVTQPPVAPPPGAQRGPAPTIPGEAEAEARLSKIAQAIAALPPKDVTGREALKQQYQAVLGQTKWDKEIKTWHMENLDSFVRGEPTVNLAEWRRLQASGPKMLEHAMDAAKVNYDLGTKARSTINTIDVMEMIRSNPKFVAGPGAPGYAQAISALGSLRDVLQAHGVKNLPDLTAPMTRAGLIQTYNSMASRLVLEAAGGSFGNQVSNSDRDFIVGIMPYLSQTKEGQKMLHEITKEFAKRNLAISNLSRTYMAERGTRATREGLEGAIEKYAEKNRMFKNVDETNTPLGERLNKLFSAESVRGESDRMSAANPFGAALRMAPSIVEGARRMMAPGQAAPAAPIPITREHEGKSGTLPDGKRFTIRGGQMVIEEQ